MDDTGRWRTGRKVGRTIYYQRGPQPSDSDELIGVMDTAALALGAVAAVNRNQAAVAGVLEALELGQDDLALERARAALARLDATTGGEH